MRHHRRYAALVGRPTTSQPPQYTLWKKSPLMNAHEAMEELTRRVVGFRSWTVDTVNLREPTVRERAFSREFIKDLLVAGWTPPPQDPK